MRPVSGTGGEDFGGLIGINYYGSVTACYATGSVGGTGEDFGGLLGWDVDGSITACFWDIETSGQRTSAGGIGKTTAEMKTKSTFTNAGWDFVDEIVIGTNDYWRMCVDGVQYPVFSWQFVPDFVCPDGVDILDLAFFVDKWLADCDEANDFCKCADTNYDQQVDFRDFAILAEYWLSSCGCE